MIYSDRDIRGAMELGEIEIEGLREGSIQPASVDLRLSSESPLFIGWTEPGTSNHIDPRKDIAPRMYELPYRRDYEAWVLPAKTFALASTAERVALRGSVVGRLEGKSSLARLGLMVHITAGFFDPGFEGFPTLELYNCTDHAILLVPDMPICQMAFEPTMSPSSSRYEGKYQNQGAAPRPSSFHENFEK